MLPCTGLVHHVPHSASGDNCMRRFVLSALCLSFAAVPGLLAAQGFGIYEQGTCSMGRAGTGVAAPCADGSALFFNPAGLAGLPGGHATIGVTLINVDGGFTDDIFQRTSHLQDPLIALPQVYVSYAATPKLGVGVGLFAPYGLQTEWPLSFDGRFAGYKNIIRSVYIQPTVAYQVTPWLSQGATNLIVPATIAVGPLVIPAGTPIDGLLASPPLDLFNTVLTTQTVTTSITNPEQVVFGLAYKVNPAWTVFGDYQFTRWGKRFSVVNINFANPLLNRVLYESYRNPHALPPPPARANNATRTFRGGYPYHHAAPPPPTLTP